MAVRSAYSCILLASVCLFLSVALWPIASYAAQQSPLSPTATQVEVQTYEAFRSWITSQPPDVQQLFAPLRVVRYEDTDAVGDFGQFDTRVVRLAAVKP